MNAHASLPNGDTVFAEVNWGKTGVDEVWLASWPDVYLYTAGTAVDVFRSDPYGYLAEFQIHEDTESGDWFIFKGDDPDRLVVRGPDRLRALGLLLTAFGDSGVK